MLVVDWPMFSWAACFYWLAASPCLTGRVQLVLIRLELGSVFSLEDDRGPCPINPPLKGKKETETSWERCAFRTVDLSSVTMLVFI